MRVFVTGATGFIGAPTVGELRATGHEVVGLARSDASAAALAAMGAEAHRGDILDDASLSAAARDCDGIIHLAYDHSDLHAYAPRDEAVLRLLTAPLLGTGKPIVAASVTGILSQGVVGTENDPPSPTSVGTFRTGSENVIQEAARDGARAMTVRMPPTVHGPNDRGPTFVPRLIALARESGVSAYVGDGENRWPAVHLLDTAHLLRLALEQGAPGARFHAVAESGIPVRRIAETIGEKLGIPVRSLTMEQAETHFGFLAKFVAMDIPCSSEITRASLGWNPTHPDLLEDLKSGTYFD